MQKRKWKRKVAGGDRVNSEDEMKACDFHSLRASIYDVSREGKTLHYSAMQISVYGVACLLIGC